MILRLISLRILRNYEKTLPENLDSMVLRLKMIKFQFGSSILEIYS
jgi:hypothetical protein